LERKRHYRGLIALQQVPALGLQRARMLLQNKTVGDASDIFGLTLSQLMKTDGIGENVARNIVRFDNWQFVDDILRKTEKCGSRLVSFDDSHYPELLRHIYDPPLVLWLKGDPDALNKHGIGVVGTRRPGKYGLEQTAVWSQHLSQNGLCINSGLAYGVDAAAHQAALDAGGTTVAVLGSGIDVIYPARNSRLAAKMMENGGAVITEYPPGTPPDAVNFPGRNRIVSGMSHGILVIETGIKGGSMITARYALDQNREVFAIPHALGKRGGEGCNYLIRTGQGKLVQSLSDIFDEISLNLPGSDKSSAAVKTKSAWKEMDLKEDQKRICELLEAQQMHIDQISERLEIPGYRILPVILEMELMGIIKQRAGRYFELN
jgi:DNA processing protein